MEKDILTLEEACELLGVSEKTLIKMLREEHIPARKIGREWRFSRKALIDWIASGDSSDYINQTDVYEVYDDIKGNYKFIIDRILYDIAKLQSNNHIKSLLDKVEKDIVIPDDISLRVSYKQKRDIEKLEFKMYWKQRDEYKINIKDKTD